MKTLTSTWLTLLTIFLCQNVAYAATSEVTWSDYEKYRDIDPSTGSKKFFRERTFKNFEKHFAKLAKNLPEGQVLKIGVSDVDLAGDTHLGGINRLRIVKGVYFPRMDFSYQLVDADGNDLVAATIELKDMSFMMRNNLKYRRDSLSYEKRMLDEWFFDVFKDRLVDIEK
ncbi:MAG: DUF3016 domain-containing protein [Colwellia sp.]|nr:DUF3016 domain-containing protein [Colwellia sp.]